MVQCNILNYAQSEGSRDYYVEIFIKCISVQTTESPYEPLNVAYAQIHPYIYCSMEYGCTYKYHPM